ncbi:MAG: gephyrin-like molybdotransferase Glp [Pyrinomonadaceae bacterium]
MIPVSQAIEIVKQNTPRLKTETAALEFACQRILAQPIIADMDMPPFNRSQMDGYAVKASDTKNAPVRLRIVGESSAGKSWSGKLKVGEAVRIMTGAALPEGASAVQKLEVTSENGEFVEIFESANKGQNIISKGAEIEQGKLIFSAGEIVNASMIASLAAFGYANILVGMRPKVAVLSTGNEIVNVNQLPLPDQIRNSNTPTLRVYAEQYGAIVESLPIIGDELGQLKEHIKEAAAKSDVLVLTGGVSVGKYDLTKLALNELGATIYFEKIALRPGKPMVFARLHNTLIFALPGNPVSAVVTFLLFVRMSLLQLQGASDIKLKSGAAVLAKTLKGARERDSYLPVRLSIEDDAQLIAEPFKWGGSSDFVSFAKADALVIIPQNTTIVAGKIAKIVFL